MESQKQLFYIEQKKISQQNLLFLEMVNDGLTKKELQENINKRPELWGRYKNWLEKLS